MAAPFERPQGGDGDAQAARLVVHDDHAPDGARHARRPDGADLRGGADPASARAARTADPPGRRDGIELPGSGAAGAVRGRGPETPADGRGARPDPTEI